MRYLIFFLIVGMISSCTPSPTGDSIRFMIGTTDKSDSAGIHFALLDPESGEVSLGEVTKTAPSPGYICFSPDKKALFVVTGDHRISSYKVSEGTLALINSQPAEGLNPCHVSLLPSGKMAFLANYSDGSFSAYNVGADFSLTPAVYKEQYEGSGPNEKRQEKAHAHCAVVSPDGQFVYVADLGTDKVMNYRIDEAGGKVEPNPAQPFFSVSPGAGPRHLVVHPSGKWLYLLNELDATISATIIDENGALTILDTYPTLPPDYTEPGNTSAAIRLHPNGNFLYVSNRGYDAIHGYRIESDGRLTKVSEAREDIAVPRDFNIDPSGKFMIVGNQKTNDLTVLEVNPETGALTHKSVSESIASPSCIAFF